MWWFTASQFLKSCTPLGRNLKRARGCSSCTLQEKSLRGEEWRRRLLRKPTNYSKKSAKRPGSPPDWKHWNVFEIGLVRYRLVPRLPEALRVFGRRVFLSLTKPCGDKLWRRPRKKSMFVEHFSVAWLPAFRTCQPCREWHIKILDSRPSLDH